VSARRSPPRSRPRCVHADYPCEDFLDRRQCPAVAQILRGQRQARQARLDRVRRICTHIAGHFIKRGCSCRARCFRSARLRPYPRRRRRPCRRDEGRIGQRRSVVEYRRGGFEMRAGRRERQRTRNNREGTMPLSSKAADRTCRVAPTARVVEPPLYTVEGRQTGDSRRKCDSATDSQGKTALAIGWKVVPFGRDGRQGALSVRRGEGVVHAAHLGGR
jgi:hypothetical protein